MRKLFIQVLFITLLIADSLMLCFSGGLLVGKNMKTETVKEKTSSTRVEKLEIVPRQRLLKNRNGKLENV